MTVDVLLVPLVALLGLGVGSAAAHLGEATLAKRAVAAPRCPYCTAPYTPLQWSATLALLVGRGRCPVCGRRVRAPRVAGELLLAIGWGLLVGIHGLTPRVGFAMLALIPQAIIMVTDLEARLVPNRIMLPSLAAILIAGTLFGPALPEIDQSPWWLCIAGAGVGFGVFRVLVWVGVAIFGEGALGEGDMTLATYVGGVVGFPLIVESLVLTFALGGVGALLVLLVRRGGLRTAIPYGPFIILGCAITQIWGASILAWYLS